MTFVRFLVLSGFLLDERYHIPKVGTCFEFKIKYPILVIFCELKSRNVVAGRNTFKKAFSSKKIILI